MLFPLVTRKLIRGFQAHIDAGLSGAADYVAPVGTPIYSPFYGTVYHFQEAKGGNWIGVKRDDGLHFEFAHLSAYKMPDGAKCHPGDLLALSGNTGTETTGPHMHHQILDQHGNRIDPEEFYSATNIHVTTFNADIPFMQEFQKNLINYSAGMLTCTWDIIKNPIYIAMGLLKQEVAYQIADDFNKPEYLPYRYLFMIYNGNISSTFLASYYYPQLNNCISTVPLGSDPALMVFELSHQLQMFYNENRGALPPIQIVDSNYPSEDLIRSKYRSVLDHVDVLLKIS